MRRLMLRGLVRFRGEEVMPKSLKEGHNVTTYDVEKKEDGSGMTRRGLLVRGRGDLHKPSFGGCHQERWLGEIPSSEMTRL